MPQDPNIIATKTSSGEIHLFNINLSYMDDKPDPELRLQGHSKKGAGLDWNENRKGQLLSGAQDGKICIWNTDSEGSTGDSFLKPTITFETNRAPVSVSFNVFWQKLIVF